MGVSLMSKDAVERITDDMILADDGGESRGYDGEGWYFWDETWAFIHGPFATEEEAREKYTEYGTALSKEA